ncbi:DnaD domain protein [Streptococcus parauberis]|uniref:DnaD domain protein n=1 Tax=Streptococcus TaxID=1301 RepID=UPI00288F9D9D|nr:DnaD domain protein [Streptococcus parauberis]MDT2749544.1 DnaD domain protein [Streptococcus parauberis]
MMKPIDEFYYVKNNKILYNSNSLIQVYAPIIGNDAVLLYQYFIEFFDDARRSHKFSEILNQLQFGMSRFEDAMVLLTAMNLVTFYQLPDGYAVKLQTALDVEEFLSSPVYKRLLEQKIGDLAVSEMQPSVPKYAQDISKKFSDVFSTDVKGQVAAPSTKKRQVQFDLESFKRLMTRDGLQFKNENEAVVGLYSFSEQYGLTWFDTYQVAKATAINGKISPSRMHLKQSQSAVADTDATFSEPEKVIITAAKNDTALQFLEKIKKARRATVTQGERDLLLQLAEMNFLDEVINVMVLYTFNKTNSANLQKNYLLKIANDFSYQNIASANQAVLKMRSFEERKQQATSKAKPKKSNVPEWSNPDYQESTSQAEQEELNHFKEEALFRLKNLRKGGD